MAKLHYKITVGVEAFKMVSVESTAADKTVVCSLDNGTTRELTPEMTARYMPQPGDYLIRQPDGYEYINPREVVEEKFEQLGNSITQEHISDILSKAEITDLKIGEKTTLVHVVLPNGFVFVESSTCVSPENYNHGIGKQTCIKRIMDRLWELEGYLLACRLGRSVKADADRAEAEHK